MHWHAVSALFADTQQYYDNLVKHLSISPLLSGSACCFMNQKPKVIGFNPISLYHFNGNDAVKTVAWNKIVLNAIILLIFVQRVSLLMRYYFPN